jgi:hypothetical protein
MLDNRVVNRALHRRSMKVEQPACRILLDLLLHMEKMKKDFYQTELAERKILYKTEEIKYKLGKLQMDLSIEEKEINEDLPINA